MGLLPRTPATSKGDVSVKNFDAGGTAIKLKEGERIVTAWAEDARGPGWSNTVVWYITKTREGKLQQCCMQPNEQNSEIRTLFRLSVEMQLAMVRAATQSLIEKR